MKIISILAAFIVNFGFICGQLHTQTVDQLQNLFNSIAKNDTKNSDVYHQILKEEAAREQRAFDGMKQEMLNARFENSYKRRNFYAGSKTSENSLTIKRETNEENKVIGEQSNRNSTTIRAVKRMAVTPVIGSEQCYIRVKKTRLPTQNFESETLKMKTDICATILRSSPTNAHEDLDVISLHEKGTIEELKQTHPLIYKNLFHNKSAESSSAEFTNPYVVRDISVETIMFQERVFSCLARNRRKTTSVLHYFISPEYDVNESMDEAHEEIMGRFVFANNQVGKLVVIAVAEEPALILPHGPDSVEHLFQEELNDEAEQSRRIICDITQFQKVRLCTSILSLDDKIQLVVDKDYADPKCVLKEIHSEHYLELHYNDDYDQWWEPTLPVEEWTLACKARQIGNEEPVTYFVSRGFVANKFFISRERQKNMTLVTVMESMCSKVSVVPAVYM